MRDVMRVKIHHIRHTKRCAVHFNQPDSLPGSSF
jgi:hypothetical protein